MEYFNIDYFVAGFAAFCFIMLAAVTFYIHDAESEEQEITKVFFKEFDVKPEEFIRMCNKAFNTWMFLFVSSILFLAYY